MMDTMSGNENEQGSSHFSRGISREKHERIARNSLYDMFAFYETLEKEISRIGEIPTKLSPTETEILQRMLAVQEHYLTAMKGFKELGAETQQHALVRFSDALLDMMKILHKHKGH
jgi:hypothetical protein